MGPNAMRVTLGLETDGALAHEHWRECRYIKRLALFRPVGAKERHQAYAFGTMIGAQPYATAFRAAQALQFAGDRLGMSRYKGGDQTPATSAMDNEKYILSILYPVIMTNRAKRVVR